MPTGIYPRKPWVDRFWSAVDSNKKGCWNWKRGLFRDGYGHIRINGVQERAHRIAWTIANGPIPNGFSILHRCDNRACCRIEHLFLGTQAENMADKVSKGRQLRGSAHGQSKITEKDVNEIFRLRSHKKTQKGIAKMFNVSIQHISDILNKKRWKHFQADILRQQRVKD